ncbi:hypothetical protein LCGC14_0464940 [marine sediment metagenome]|uniref:Tyr recombinase domain-containing protein n=1 Tax=marine sediment metagenome TaxID=412755 RepID=A0A0F9SWZ3_9ZZZZ
MSLNQKKHEWVPYQEIKNTIESMTNPEIKAFTSLMFATGCRVGEMSYNYEHNYAVYTIDDEDNKIKTGEKKVVTNGIRVKDIDINESRIRIRSPNFKYRKMTEKKAYVTLKLEPWLFWIIVNYISGWKPEEYIFSHSKRYYQYQLKKAGWKYTSHSLRKSRANFMLFDVSMNPRAVADMLGHADLTQIMTYTKTPESEYLDKMDKAKLPGDNLE